MPDAVALVEARTALATLQSELATAHQQWSEGGKTWDAVTILAGNDFDKYQAMMEKETKANELGAEVQRLAALESSQGMMDRIGNNAVQRGHMSEPQAETYLTAVAGRKLGSFYVNHPSVRAAPDLAHAPIITLPGYANALFRTGAGADPGESREAGIERVDPGLRGLREIVPAAPTIIDDITYLRQSTRAGNPGAVTEPATAVEPGTGSSTPTEDEAARTAALGYAPELTAVLAEVTSAVSDVLAFLPVTEKQLRQPAEIGEYLDTEGDYEMETAIERWLAESAVVNNLGFWRYGTGTAHNQMRVQAQGSDDNFEAIFKGMALAREQGGIVTGVVMAPQIYAALMLAKQSGIYALGGPVNMGTPRIWGAPLVQTSFIATARDEIAIAGDFSGGARIRVREDISLEINSGYLDYFRRALLAYRWKVVFALDVRRPQHFCQITGLTP